MTNRQKKSRATSMPTSETARRACEAFNSARKTGDRCHYFPVKGREDYKETRLGSGAWVLPSNIVVALVEGVAGGVNVDHLTFVPAHPLHDHPSAWIASVGTTHDGKSTGNDSLLVRFKHGKILLLNRGIARLVENDEAMAQGYPPLYPAWPIDTEEMCREEGV